MQMEASEVKGISHERDSSQCVRVAVNIRPLITPELIIGCTDCITVVPGEPQVQIGTHAFTFDSVYGNGGSQYSKIYSDCIAPLVDALFHGYNATVLAYGQTGSGKTFTMGTNYHGNDNDTGIIPHVMKDIFSRVKTMNDSAEFVIRVSFIEIFKEEVFDLLDQSLITTSRMETSSHVKTSVPARVPIQIRETMNGGITLSGVTEAEVRTKEEMASFLSHGSLTRATASTSMNSQSSRSHAIFTISMEQKRLLNFQSGVADECLSDDILTAKLHLVDLAGSERVKRTKADGMRFKEGVHINKGLLALGNVISALGDEKRRKEGGHVPYRDSKLTRLLQDSLGGNSKTVMIACVSPADSNAEETLNTLKYANRARNIQNKAIINRDPVAGEMQRLRSLIEQLQSELIFFRGDASTPLEEIEILKQKNSLLEEKNTKLQDRAINDQVEKDKLIMTVQALQNGKSLGEIDSILNQEVDLIKQYVTKIQELEGELQLQKMRYSNHLECLQSHDSIENGFHINLLQSGMPNDYSSDLGDSEVDEKEVEHSSIQENFDRELKELEMKLEQKEAEMKQFSSTSTLKQIYEKKFFELEHEKKVYLKEIDELRHNLTNISSASDDGAQKIKHDYLQKLNALETQLADLRKKQDAQSQQLRQKRKSDEAAKRLQEEIQRIKSQKVHLQHKMKHESEQFRLWKVSREKEVLQLKKESRRNEYEMHKLSALNQRQKMVLQRKTEEASVATKRLKELLESRKTSSAIGNGPGIQALMQTIEHELEVTVRVHEVRSEYEHQLEERASMAKEVAELKEEALLVKQNKISRPELTSPGARNSRIFALENMLSTSSNTLVSMASQLSAAEERERLFSGKGRWNQVRSLPEAKNVMNYLFNVASSSRCQLRDKEAVCREKDSEIKVQKEKTVQLGSVVRQLEMQLQQHKLLDASLKSNPKEHSYDLRKGRSSAIFNVKEESIEDMDTSNSDLSDEEWVASGKVSTNSGDSDDEGMKLKMIKSGGGACCTCSKKSSCKTLKCKCRSVRDVCSILCGCVASRCSNRDNNRGEMEYDNNSNGSEEGLGTHVLASRGVFLLQDAFSALPDRAGEDSQSGRKALSDIGNTAVKRNAGRPPKGKKLKKQVIQIVPVVAQAEEGAAKAEESGAEMGLKSRPTRSTISNHSTQLRDRNSDPSSASASVAWQDKSMDGKENQQC